MKRFWCLLALLAGCPSTSFKSAKTLPEGETRYIAGVSFNGGNVRDRRALEAPELTFGVRHGETEDFDVGVTFTALPLGRAFTELGIEVSAQSQLQSAPEHRFDISLGSHAAYHLILSSSAAIHVASLGVPLLLGDSFGERAHRWVFAPEVGLQTAFNSGASTVFFGYTGFTLGAEWKLKKRTLLTQISTYKTSAGIESSRGSIMTHQGIGFAWGPR